jgi:8-oxo-dGTP pyrophosphatase MutT (NUDIX family)
MAKKTTGSAKSAPATAPMWQAAPRSGFSKCISYDCDGVLHANPGWSPAWSEFDTTLISEAHARGVAVAVSTCNDTWRVAAKIKSRGFRVHDDNKEPVGRSFTHSPTWHGGDDGTVVLVTNRKVCAFAYVDDKAYHYQFRTDPMAVWMDLDAKQGYHACVAGQHRHWGPNGAAGVLPVAVRNGQVCIMLTHRSAAVQGGECWSTPGGAIDGAEVPSETARRETAEEVKGLGDLDFCGEYVDECPHGCGWSYTTFIADCGAGPDVKLADTWENTGVRWFPVEDLPKLKLHPVFAAVLPKLLNLAIELPLDDAYMIAGSAS